MTKIVIDGDFIPYYVGYTKKGDPEKTLDQVIDECNNIVWNILVQTQASEYIGFLGVKGEPTFRHKIYPEYKGQRTTELPLFFREVRKHLIEYWKFVFAPSSIETDDAVNITRIRTNAIAVSPDKDLLQLEGKHYNPKKKVWVDNTFLYQEAAFAFWKDMFVGQTGDNIKGIPQIGEVTARRYLLTLDTKNKDIPAIKQMYASKTLEAYIQYFGMTKGISEFQKNYTCLKILEPEDMPDFIVPAYNPFIVDEFIIKQLNDDRDMEIRQCE
jgi:5'-3' exonuclease